MRAQEADAESITIGYRTRDAAHADGPSGASYVFNDDGLAERDPHALGHNPPDRIGRPASGKRHNHRDRACRVGLRLLRPRRERPRRCAAEDRDELAASHVWMAPAWQEIIWRAAQRSLAVMCPACWCSPGGLLALMGS